MIEFLETIKTIVAVAEKSPVALRAVRIFGVHILSGQNIRDALVKTAETLAAEELI